MDIFTHKCLFGRRRMRHASSNRQSRAYGMAPQFACEMRDWEIHPGQRMSEVRKLREGCLADGKDDSGDSSATYRPANTMYGSINVWFAISVSVHLYVIFHRCCRFLPFIERNVLGFLAQHQNTMGKMARLCSLHVFDFALHA